MNAQMAYLIGMILGNGELQCGDSNTIFTIEIPFKNLKSDLGHDVGVYVKASITDIEGVIAPLIATPLTVTIQKKSVRLSFTKNNQDYTAREILRLIGRGVHHSTMRIHEELFGISRDEKIELLRGIADVTGYIRASNYERRGKWAHRVYIEVPRNWYLAIDIANMLKSLDIPIQNIDFGHPNFRDPNLKYKKLGKVNYWKKEHQIKIWANEFAPIGFNIIHKQKALDHYSKELLSHMNSNKTHKFYWQTKSRIMKKLSHPGENDISLPSEIRGKHFDSWKVLAKELGYYAES